MPDFVPPSPEELSLKFPNYEIESFIAQGGMGAVYLGRQLSLDRPVAIKILPPELCEDRSYITSFESEAKSLAKLNHSNLVGIYDFGQINGMFFIIMEYVPGRSLYYTAHGEAVDEHEGAFLISEICKGLEHAHEHGILHRDIKPANILIDDEARPMLVDFGLAKPMSDNEHEGVIFGTPGYTAPEVLANPHQVDHRADIFSVGVLLYELLTGALPDDPITPASERNDTDPRFDFIINKAMHPLVTLRYSSCAAMAQDLDDLIANWDEQPEHAHTGEKILAAAATVGAAPRLLAAGAPVQQHAAAAPQAVASKAQSVATPSLPGLQVKKKSGGGASLIVALLIIVAAIGGGYYFFDQNQKAVALTREQNRKAKYEAFQKKKADEELRKAEAEKKQRAKEATRERKRREREAAEEERVRLEQEARNADLARRNAADAKRRAEEEEAARIAAEQAKVIKNGPKAIVFNPQDYLNNGRQGVARYLSKSRKSIDQELASNIGQLEQDAENEVERLPRSPRAEAKKVVESVMKQLKSEGTLPENAPEDSNVFILNHYPKALERQQKILQKLDLEVSKVQEKYLKGIEKKMTELKDTENFVEIEVLRKATEAMQDLASFKAAVL